MKFIKDYYIIITIVIIGIALRLYHNTDISLWHDEAFSALYIKYPWSEMMYRIGLDVHPPLYYIALRLWHYIFGDSLLALRSFSVLFGVGIIPLSYLFVKETFQNHKAALWTALLIAVNPFQIQYVTEVRMYTFGAFFALLAAYLLVKALKSERLYYNRESLINTGKQATLYYACFGLCVSAIMYTHYYLFFTAASLVAFGLLHHIFIYKLDFKKYLRLFLSFGISGILFIPWLETFLFQFKQVSNAFWIPKMDIWSIPTTIWQMLFAFGIDIQKTQSQILVIGSVLFTLIFLFSFLKTIKENGKWLVVMCLVAPFAGALLFALLGFISGKDSSVFLVRYFLFASVFYTIALGVWLSKLRLQTLGLSLLIIFSILNITAFYKYWDDLKIYEKPGMKAAAKLLNANVTPNDKLYVGSSFEFFNLKYYLNSPVKPLLFSGGNRDIKNLPHFAGTAILTNEDLLPDFTESTKPGDKVWLLWTNGFGGSKPTTPNNWVQTNEQGFAEVRPYVGTWIIITEYQVK